MINVNNLNKSFGKGQSEIKVIKSIDFNFKDKGLYIIHGRSGSGKTTFLNVLSGLDKPKSGTINFDGKEIPKYDNKTWDDIRANKIGFVFQNYYLIPSLSVYDNVAYVLKLIGINQKEEIDKRVNYVLSLLGLYQYRFKMSHALSGGQMQRVAIARALVKNPYVIIADEPTGNLDSLNTIEVMNIIKQISKDKLVILVTHEETIAKFYGDYIIEYNDGEIKSFTENTAVRESLYDTQNIYLKDMTQTNLLTNQTDNTNININLFSDSTQIPE
jgi:ABC-type lipoprotein export system ATPase subunit